MKARMRSQSPGAMTVFEMLMVIVCRLIAAAMLLWLLAFTGRGLQKICASAIGRIDIAFRIWQGDNVNRYQTTVSTNGGAIEPIEAANLSAYFQLTSNGLRTPKIFICPADMRRTFATNSNERKRSHVSYLFTPNGLQWAFQRTELATNRIAIP